MDRVPIRTGGASASEPGTDDNHAPIFQLWNGGSSERQ